MVGPLKRAARFPAVFQVLIASGALAGGADYSLVPVTTHVSLATAAQQPIKIKFIDKSGTPVRGVTILRVRLDMSPDGMAQHTASVQLTPVDEPGLYAVDARYSMTGHWQLSLAARVEGETETVTGKVVFEVAP